MPADEKARAQRKKDSAIFHFLHWHVQGLTENLSFRWKLETLSRSREMRSGTLSVNSCKFMGTKRDKGASLNLAADS